ncbi:hypothetical protein, partial [Legionella pneumophila]
MHLVNSYRPILGGWHRLWIVFCVVSLAIIFVTNKLYVGLNPEYYSFRNEFYEALSIESKNKIIEINVADELGALSNSFEKLINPKNRWLILSNIDGKLKDSIMVKMPNNQTIAFKRQQKFSSIKNVCEEYWDIIKNYARKQEKINPNLIKILSYWIKCCIFLY